MTVPEEAVTLADDVLQRAGACVSREDTREALAAAAPLIAAAERERLREAFGRIQELAATLQEAAVERAVTAERQRIRQLAIEHDAWTTEDGGPYHRDTVRRFATLLDAP